MTTVGALINLSRSQEKEIAMRRWMLVSKPLREPFNDGTLVFCRALVQHSSEEMAFSYFGDPQNPLREESFDEVLESSTMGFSPGILKKAKLLLSLLNPFRRKQPLHFLFTPNTLTSNIVRLLRLIYPHRPMIQTVMSSDGIQRFIPFLGALDGIAVFSQWARKLLIEGGIPPEKIVVIYPAITQILAPKDLHERRAFLYAGDLDKKVAHHIIEIVHLLEKEEDLQDWTFIAACRPKSPEDAEARTLLRKELADAIDSGRFELLGEVPNMNALFERAAFQLFLSDHLHKKVDIPFVLLEGFARGLGLIALDIGPIAELFELAAEEKLDIGTLIPLEEKNSLPEKIISALQEKQRRTQWSFDAMTLVQRHFWAVKMAEKYEKFYNDILTFQRKGD